MSTQTLGLSKLNRRRVRRRGCSLVRWGGGGGGGGGGIPPNCNDRHISQFLGLHAGPL